jgi:glycosyltransferase EpsH
VEKYLSKCLHSLISQTFQDIEIICVNDGSTDNSAKIIQDFAKQDTRIKVIDKENGGLFSARHEGMKYITGEYVIFVDSDDWVCENLVDKCLNSIKAETDIVVFGAFSVREKNGKTVCNKGGYDCSKIPTKFNKKNIFKFPPTAWSKMYRTEFLRENNIRFQEIKNGEDQLFFIHSMLCAKNINVVHENLYYYIKSRAGAITAVKQKTSLSPIFNCYAIDDLLSNMPFDDNYKKFILSKYFEKSLSWYTKSSPEISKEFYNKVLKLQNHLSNKYPNYWWAKFNLNPNDKYWQVKLKLALKRNVL